MVSSTFTLISLGVFTSFVIGQSSVVSNPNTIYLTQTNSEGVITGQPSVITSQPALPSEITSLPPGASLPMLQDGTTTLVFDNATYTVAVLGTSTSLITPTPSTSSVQTIAATTTSSHTSKGLAAAATGNIVPGFFGRCWCNSSCFTLVQEAAKGDISADWAYKS